MDAIFPKASMPILSLAANLGLVLFLFLVGLEVDLRVLTRNWKTAASVGALGMIIPFGLGAFHTPSIFLFSFFATPCVGASGMSH